MVLCLSGGVDSMLLARMAGDALKCCVFVDYGQPAAFMEQSAARWMCYRMGVQLHIVTVRGIPLGDMATLTGACVVPNRNAMLLTAASNYANGQDCDSIWIGCNRSDYHDYEDCRPEFIKQMEKVLGVWVEAPLTYLTKAEIVAFARGWGITEQEYWSCYGPGPVPCGECASCKEVSAAKMSLVSTSE